MTQSITFQINHMAIIIKEIQVKTTIESRVCAAGIDEQRLQNMKYQIMQEVKQLVQKEIKQKEGR